MGSADPSSPYDFESVTLIIKSQNIEPKVKQRAGMRRHEKHRSQRQIQGESKMGACPKPGSPSAAQLQVDAHTQALSLLSWLVDLAALCDADNTVLHIEACLSSITYDILIR